MGRGVLRKMRVVRLVTILALVALAAGVHVDVSANLRVNDDIDNIRQKLANSDMPEAAKENAFSNLDQMQEDVQELQMETSPEKAAHLQRAIQLRLAVLNQQLTEDASSDDRVWDDIEKLKDVVDKSELTFEQKKTALSNLDKIKRDVAEINDATPERKEELKEALQLRLAALNHQLGTDDDSNDAAAGEANEPNADDVAAMLLSAILPNGGDGIQQVEVDIPAIDLMAGAESAAQDDEDARIEECEEVLRSIPPMLAGGLRCPVHRHPPIATEHFQQMLQHEPPIPHRIFPFGTPPAFAPSALDSPFNFPVQYRTIEPPLNGLGVQEEEGIRFSPFVFRQLPIHLQNLAESEPFHDVASLERQPMVLKMEEKDGFNVITGWFPGVVKSDMHVKLFGDSLKLEAAVTNKEDTGLGQDNVFHFNLREANHVDEELELPYAPSANTFKAHFNEEKHTFVAVFPTQKETVEIPLQ